MWLFLIIAVLIIILITILSVYFLSPYYLNTVQAPSPDNQNPNPPPNPPPNPSPTLSTPTLSTPNPSPTPSPNLSPSIQETSNNMLLGLGIGIGILILLGGVFVIKKKKRLRKRLSKTENVEKGNVEVENVEDVEVGNVEGENVEKGNVEVGNVLKKEETLREIPEHLKKYIHNTVRKDIGSNTPNWRDTLKHSILVGIPDENGGVWYKNNTKYWDCFPKENNNTECIKNLEGVLSYTNRFLCYVMQSPVVYTSIKDNALKDIQNTFGKSQETHIDIEHPKFKNLDNRDIINAKAAFEVLTHSNPVFLIVRIEGINKIKNPNNEIESSGYCITTSYKSYKFEKPFLTQKVQLITDNNTINQPIQVNDKIIHEWYENLKNLDKKNHLKIRIFLHPATFKENQDSNITNKILKLIDDVDTPNLIVGSKLAKNFIIGMFEQEQTENREIQFR